MKEGDFLVTYMSGIKAFIDVRRVESAELIKLRVRYDNDDT